MKNIISLMLAVVMSVMLIGCSAEWDELMVSDNHVSYNKGELPCQISVGVNQATVSFNDFKTGMIFLNGKYLDDFKDQWQYTICNLKSNEKYTILVTCMVGEEVLSKTFEITTNVPFITQIGWHELDIYNYEEKELDAICPYPGGGFVDDTYVSVRRLDANGNVMWRTEMNVSDFAVSDEGGIAVLGWASDDFVSRIEPETGKVLYECRPTDKEIMVKGVYPCRDGGVVLVGRKIIIHDDADVPNEEYYYLGLFDAKGKAIHEELGSEATCLYKIVEKVGGGFIAMGMKGEHAIALITFDSKGKKVSAVSEYSEYRASDFADFDVHEAKRDKDGYMYFLINENIYYNYYYTRSLVVKVNPNGKIVWTRPLVGDMSSCANTMYILDDNRLCVAYGQDNWVHFNTVIVTMTKDNEILRGDNLGVEIPPVAMFPLNDECTEFRFYDQYGRILHVNLEAQHEEVPFVLREGW